MWLHAPGDASVLLCSGARGGGYDSYAPDAQANSQSFGPRGSGGFDNYNSKGGQSGGRRGREDGGSFAGGGGGGGAGYESNSYEAPANECMPSSHSVLL